MKHCPDASLPRLDCAVVKSAVVESAA